MVGLVYIDQLRLTPLQWAAVGAHAAGWLWVFRATSREEGLRSCSLACLRGVHGLGPAALLFLLLWLAFWGRATCIDTAWLIHQSDTLAHLPWSAFVDQMLEARYIDKHVPFLTFWIARLPILWAQQLLWLPWALLCAGLMWELYGRYAALLLATPLCALLLHQPSNDTLLFGALLIVLRLLQLADGVRRPALLWRLLAGVVYGLTWMIKPLVLVTAPVLLPRLGLAGLVSVSVWGGYVSWSLRWAFGRVHLRFLLTLLYLSQLFPSGGAAAPSLPGPDAAWQRVMPSLFRQAAWSWTQVGSQALRALPFYLWPAYARPWTRTGLLLTALIVLGHGNVKYLLVALPFVFPVQPEEP